MKFLNRNRESTVSLNQKNINWILFSKLLKWGMFIISILAVYKLVLNFSIRDLMKAFCCIGTFKIVEKLELWCRSHFYYKQLLCYFIRSNKLFSEIIQNGKKYIVTSAIMGWRETDNKIIILGYKQGDSYSKRLESLDTELSALLELPLESKVVRPAVVEYHFFTKKTN